MERLDTGVSLTKRHWYSVGVSFDADKGELWLGHSAHAPLTGIPVPTAESVGSVSVEPSLTVPFRVAAGADTSATRANSEPANCLHFNGKIEAPAIFSATVAPTERAAFLAAGTADSLTGELAARWDFSRNMAACEVQDLSAHGCHGTLVNMPTRAMKSSD